MLVSVSDTLPDMRERGNLSQLSREKEETCPSSQETTDAGRDWGQEEKGTTEDEMAGWHH